MTAQTLADAVHDSQWSRQLDAHRQHLLKVARALLRDSSSAEDVVQETLLAALHGVARFEHRASLRTWLTVILKRKVLDLLRASRRTPLPVSQLPAMGEAGACATLFDERGTWLEGPPVWDSPEQALMQSDFMKVFEECLRKLPAPAARAFVLRSVLDAETAEITASLGVTANSLGVTLYRARMALRACLSRNWFSHRDDA